MALTEVLDETYENGKLARYIEIPAGLIKQLDSDLFVSLYRDNEMWLAFSRDGDGIFELHSGSQLDRWIRSFLSELDGAL